VTSKVHRINYDFRNVSYEINIMDTPGMLDSQGIQQDDVNIMNILNTTAKTPELNAIVIMMIGSDPRISVGVNYTISKLKGILPNVV